jgi:hypothetical protein
MLTSAPRMKKEGTERPSDLPRSHSRKWRTLFVSEPHSRVCGVPTRRAASSFLLDVFP